MTTTAEHTEEPQTIRARIRRFVGRRTWYLAIALAIGTAAAFMGRITWWLELASHFRLQLIYGSLVVFLLFLACRRWRGVAFALMLCGVNGAVVSPAWFGDHPELSAAADKPTMRLLIWNVFTGNQEHDALIELVREEKPDVVLLQETDTAWLASLEALAKDYPHKVARAQPDNFGIALFSKHPLTRGEIVTYGEANLPSIAARFVVAGEPVNVILTHTMPPVRRRNAKLRDDHARTVAKAARELGRRTVLAGDFNMTPWSPVFADMLELSGMRDSSVGFGVQTTWPMTLPALFRIPIDHCLHSEDLVVVDRRTTRHIGSDHLPIIVDLR